MPLFSAPNSGFYLLRHLFQRESESFWILCLDSSLDLVALHKVATGNLNFCLVTPQQLFCSALFHQAHALIIAHNHPSLNTHPTASDKAWTKTVLKIGKSLGIPILDHIIFTDQHYFSFKENGLI